MNRWIFRLTTATTTTTTFWLVLLSGVMVSSSSSSSSSSLLNLHRHNNNERPHQRNLQSSSSSPSSSSNIIYRANYTADFSHLADPSCSIENQPVLRLSCPQNLTILRVSHPSITCNLVVPENGVTLHTTSYECRNTCNTTNPGECQAVYVATTTNNNTTSSSNTLLRQGPYESIQFSCAGDQVAHVAATFTYDGGFTGSCTTADASSSVVTSSRNFHVAKLGISCPITTTMRREYIYDDTYFECNFLTGHENASGAVLNTGTTTGSSVEEEEEEEDVYTCVTGNDCGGLACADVVYNNLILTSDVSQFLHCLETTTTTTMMVVTPVPTPAPILPLPVTSYYQAQFEAIWGKLDPTATPGSTFCSSWTTTPEENPSANSTNTTTFVRITCSSDGGSGVATTAIRFHNSTDANMQCTHISDTEMICTASRDTLIQNRFTSVIYDCFGGTLPASTVTFPETTVACENDDRDVRLQNTVIMGLTCSPYGNIYSDVLFECSSARHHFDVLVNGAYNLPGDRYSCSESITISNRSSSTTSNVVPIMIIPSVAMTTDEFWLQNPVSNCTRTVDSIPTVSPSMIPTMTPVLVASNPSSPVVVVPNAPILVNNNNSSSPTTAEQNNKNGVNSSVLAVVGGIVGGIAISLIVFFVYRKGQRDGSASGSGTTGSKYHPATSAGTSTRTDQLTGGHNSDHLTRTSGSSTTNKHSSPSVTTTTPSSSSSPTRRPTTVATNYVIDYKDQARSVVDPTVPVRDSARRRIEALPMAQAVPIPMDDAAMVTSPRTTATTTTAANPTTLFDV